MVTTTRTVVVPQSRKPVGDVKVCVKDEPTIPCATTDATGYFILSGVPNDKEVILTFEKVGYFPAAVHRAKRQVVTYELVYYLMPRAEQSTWESKAGYPLDPQMGHVFISVVTESGKPATDASFTITPSAGSGVCYADASLWPDPSLSATCSSGCGVFSNLPAGTYEVQVSHPGSSACKPSVGWQGSSPSAAKLVVTADTFSAAAFVCE